MLTVEVIDSQCSLRRRHLAVRAERFLVGRGEKSVPWIVRDHTGVGEWRATFLPPKPGSLLILLHASEVEPEWYNVPLILGDLARGPSSGQVRLVTYSGGNAPLECFRVSDERSGQVYEPGLTLWWEHHREVRSRRDFGGSPASAARVGLDDDRPPVEKILGKLLFGAPRDEEATIHESISKSVTNLGVGLQKGDNGLRHRLVNAVGPLREAVDYAIASSSGVPNIERLWRHLHRRIFADRSLPMWIPELLAKCEHDLLPYLTRDSAVPEMLSELSGRLAQIEAFALALERPARSWGALQEWFPAPKDPCRVLWIEDEEAWLAALQPGFAKFGITTVHCDNVESLPAAEALGSFDAIVVDVILEGQGEAMRHLLTSQGITPSEDITDETVGLGLLEIIQALPLPPPTFILSARESPSVVRACTVLGARDYFVKGQGDYLHLLVEVRRAVQEAREKRATALRPANPRLIVSANDPVARTLLWIERIAASGSRGPVMFVGQPGVGKEEFARELYLRSSRRSGPFIVIDCSTIVPTLIESELFGHKKGAFNGAVADKPGLVEMADGGVVFVDELDKLDVALQQRFLRLAAAGEVRRVGDVRDRRVDVLLVLASNVDPRSGVGRKAFSEPLVTRIDKYLFRLPSLRDRAAAVDDLVSALCSRISAELGWPPRRLRTEARGWIKRQVAAGRFEADGGNIRGLSNLLERIMVFSPGESMIGLSEIEIAVEGDDTQEVRGGREPLREAARLAAEGIIASRQAVLREVRDEFEAELLRELVAHFGRSGAAAVLGMTDTNLRQVIKKLRGKGFWKWKM